MQVQVHTNHVVHDVEALVSHVEGVVTAALERFNGQITRVEVHLSDVSHHKPGEHDKHCMMEARPAGHQPVAVSHEAGTWEEAIHRAAEKLEAALGKLHERLGHRKGNTSFGGDQTI
jgi:ribosome-associated translation inhibitor RaiA